MISRLYSHHNQHVPLRNKARMPLPGGEFSLGLRVLGVRHWHRVFRLGQHEAHSLTMPSIFHLLINKDKIIAKKLGEKKLRATVQISGDK